MIVSMDEARAVVVRLDVTNGCPCGEDSFDEDHHDDAMFYEHGIFCEGDIGYGWFRWQVVHRVMDHDRSIYALFRPVCLCPYPTCPASWPGDQ